MKAEGPAPPKPDGFWQRLLKRLRAWFSPPPPSSDPPPPATWPEYEEPAWYEELDLENPDEAKRASRAYDLQLDDEFRRRIAEPVRISRLKLTGVDFFGDAEWELHPRVNVLLGANGYGKSLILRTLAGMLQRDEDVTGVLFADAGRDARIRLDLIRGQAEERIQRDAQIFTGAPRVPLLAIPDARFTDRSTRAGPDPNAESLAFDGARQFLDQSPYQSTIDSLLATLGIEYRLHGERFDIPSFDLLSRVLRDLTGGQFAFDHVELVGRIGSEIFVSTEGIERPLPIKQASQGTLSVVAMFGIIQAFLHDVADEGGIEEDPRAIVIIDEVDAHLHPSWQQRIRGLLVDYFPTVQFILTAHSPLVVAGCGPGEVAVLRKRTGGGSFYVDQVPGDFLAATSPELLQQLFEIEDRNPEFRRYANKADRGEHEAILARVDTLLAKRRKSGLDVEEAKDLKRLTDEANTIARVAQAVNAEREEIKLQVQVAQLQHRVEELEAEETRPEIA